MNKKEVVHLRFEPFDVDQIDFNNKNLNEHVSELRKLIEILGGK